jgi:hypothetical protein
MAFFVGPPRPTVRPREPDEPPRPPFTSIFGALIFGCICAAPFLLLASWFLPGVFNLLACVACVIGALWSFLRAPVKEGGW